MEWVVYFTEEAEDMLLRIDDLRLRKLIKSRALRLNKSPDIGRRVAGLRSVRAVTAEKQQADNGMAHPAQAQTP